MSESFELPAPDYFTTGAVGAPGQRVFYLQGRQARAVVTLKVEKEQIAALADYVAGLLAKLPGAGTVEHGPAAARADRAGVGGRRARARLRRVERPPGRRRRTKRWSKRRTMAKKPRRRTTETRRSRRRARRRHRALPHHPRAGRRVRRARALARQGRATHLPHVPAAQGSRAGTSARGATATSSAASDSTCFATARSPSRAGCRGAPTRRSSSS